MRYWKRQAEMLDPNFVDCNAIRGWRGYFWAAFGDRQYGRNVNTKRAITIYFPSVLILALLTYAYQWEPLPIAPSFLLLPIVYVYLKVILKTISLANAHWCIGIAAIGIGLSGFFPETQLSLPLPFTEKNIAPFLYDGLIIAGVLSILRRRWNAALWHDLDKIKFKYYRKHATPLPTTEHGEAYISDYCAAYNLLCGALLYQIENKVNFSEKECHQVREQLAHGTDKGLVTAIALLQKGGGRD